METKSACGAGAVDHALWAMGVRPARFSKFGAGTATLRPDLPHNRWHQALRRHEWTVARPPSPILSALHATAWDGAARDLAAVHQHLSPAVPGVHPSSH